LPSSSQAASQNSAVDHFGDIGLLGILALNANILAGSTVLKTDHIESNMYMSTINKENCPGA
jgi:hypothetical protein